MAGMKQILLMIAVVALVGCGEKTTPSEPVTKVEPTPAEKAAAEKAAAEKATAIKKVADEAQAKAFVNTLGMKFVPVPGTEVQFCIWETRVKDYTEYAAANAGVDGSWKQTGFHPDPVATGFQQADTHPVVNVSWNDANAFCAWLTKKELEEYKIKAGQKYRLPTDAEWSVAVGLGKEKGNTPGEKHRGIKGMYPWGKGYPPPKEAGNYRETLKVDNFKYTSPAGSFASNKDGLHDMGGNVWEWCEDKYSPTSTLRMLRGACWFTSYPDAMLSSSRNDLTPDDHGIGVGFRCVLVGCGKEKEEKAAKAKAAAAWVSDPNDPNNVTIEAVIRKSLKYIGESPTGELTRADLEKVTELELDDKQLTSVKSLEKLTQLESLHLPHNKLTDVKGLENLTQLKELPLDDNQLTSVKSLEKLTQLEGLWLPRNQLTDVKGLKKLTRLTELDLSNNPDLTKAQIDELQKALPYCKISSNPTK